jgi:signal transduction histidine kinase
MAVQKTNVDLLQLRSSRKLLLPTFGLSVLLFVVVAVALWHLDRQQASSAYAVAVNVTAMKAAEELEIAIRDVRYRLHVFLITEEREALKPLLQDRKKFEHWLAEARKVATTKTEQDLIRRVESDYARLTPQFDAVTAQAHAVTLKDADLKDLKTLCRSLALDEMRGMLDAAHEYLDFNEQAITESTNRDQFVTNRLSPVLFVLGLSGSAAGIFLGFAFARGLRRRVIECNIPIRAVAGSLNEVVGPVSVSTASDIDDFEPTLRHIAEQVEHVVRRLQATEREALQAEQLAAVGQLAAGMAHELRNPLTSMKALVQMAQYSDETPVLEGHDLQILQEEIDRMSVLIESFLEYARPPQLERSPVELVTFCEQTLELISARAMQKGVQVSAHLGPPLLAEVDARQLRQVLLNLFENALDAMPGGGHLWVELRRADSPPLLPQVDPWTAFEESRSRRTQGTARALEPSAGFAILVADNGCGLPESLGDNIFQPFVSTKETGLGLGLSICRRIVQAHGGEINCGRLPSGGAVFVVWIPRVEDVDFRASSLTVEKNEVDAGGLLKRSPADPAPVTA